MLSLSPLLLSLLSLPVQDAKVAEAAAEAPSPNPLIDATTWKAVVEEGKTRSQVMRHLDVLTNRIGPRLTSSRGLRNACDWARATLEGFGYDNARLEQWGEFPVGFNRGPSKGEVVAPAELARELGPLRFVTRAWSAGTRGPASGGLVALPASAEAVTEAPDAFRGRWVLGAVDGRRRMSPEHIALVDALVAAGALGLIGPSRNDLLITSGNYRITWDDLPVFPEITLQLAQYEKVAASLAHGDVELAFDIRNWFEQGPIPLHNVIADLVGSEKPDEYVVIGGHLDSWDGATGTTDNGTGTATTLEAARILMAVGARPKRTIRFMLWSGEEQGLLGSRAWVQKHRKDVVEHCSACFVHDGGTNYASGVKGAENVQDLLATCFTGFETIDPTYPFEVGQKPLPISGSDHWSFHSVGVPGFFYEQAGEADYTHTHHTQHDTFDAARPGYEAQTATVMALTALAVANHPELFPRHDPSKLQELMAQQRRGRGLDLGLTLDGRKVTEVRDGSPAARLGLEAGDELLQVAGEDFEGGDRALGRALFGWLRSGADKGGLKVKRGDDELELPLDRSLFGNRAGGSRPGGNRPGGNAAGQGRRGGDREGATPTPAGGTRR
ncbi:MAG: M20/M25/M40 family metallo-hydrolase [Planctomycetota bacterium]